MPGYQLKENSRRLMSENAPTLFVISIIVIIITTVISELIFRLPGTSDAFTQFNEQLASGERISIGLFYSNLRPVGVALAALLWLMQPVIDVGYKSYCLKLSRKSNGSYKDILDGFLYFGKIILITITTSVLILLWSLLLLFPGLVAYYRYSQAYYILLDAPEKSVIQCIRESKSLMDGKKLDLFLLDLSFLGWVILDYAVVLLLPIPFSLPIVSIFLTPYYGLTRASYYDRLITGLVV